MRPTSVRFIGLRVPRRAIAPLVGRLDDTPIRIVPRGTEALDLLLVYASAITAERRLQKPELRRLAVTHIHDLIAATVGATREALANAEGRGIRAARLRAIMADITANLEDCDLNAADARARARDDALCSEALRARRAEILRLCSRPAALPCAPLSE